MPNEKEPEVKIDETKALLDKALGRIAALEAENASFKEQNRADENASQLAERIELVAKAASILDRPVTELVRMDAADLMRECVKKEAPKVSIEGKSDDFVRGIFETISASKVDTAAALNRMAGKAKEAHRADAKPDARKVAEDARSKMIADMQGAWKSSKPAA